MKKAIRRLKPFDRQQVNVVVETPKGSRVKYNYDEDTGLFGLSQAMPEGLMFPFNFGFVPGTCAEDGDPLDILIVNEESLIPGCLLKVRLAGVIKAEQTEDGKTIRNDRVLGMAISKEAPTFLESMELDAQLLKEIEQFFVTYNKLQKKKFKVLGESGPKSARDLVKQAAKKFAKSKK